MAILTHWEYSFLMDTCNLGDSVRIGTNPFTGEAVEFPIDDGLTDDEIGAVQAVFLANGIEGPEPEFEGYATYFSDGSRLRFRCNDLDAGASVTGIAVEVVVKQLFDEILNIILNVARAGNLALMSSIGECLRIPDRNPNEKLLKRWPDAESLSSILELRLWIQNTIGGRQVRVPS